MNTGLVVILVLAFVVFFVIPVATARINAANKAHLRPRGPAPLKEMFANPSDKDSIKTGLINVGDVGMPPGYISPYYNGVIVSTIFLGPNAASVAAATPNGKYVLTVTDETGKKQSVKITNMGSGGFYYVIYNNDSTGTTISKTFEKSKKLAISIAKSRANVAPPTDPAVYGAQEFNPLSHAIDIAIPNFATEPTGIDADPNLSEIEYVQEYTNVAADANQQIQHALSSPNVPVVNQTIPPANPLARKAKKCESDLKGRASCNLLTKPEYADCGVCIKGGTQYNGATPGKFIGGLLSLKEDRMGNSVGGPTLGKCPPGMFYVDAQACQTAANRLNCQEAAPKAGRTAEGLKIPLSMCAVPSTSPDPIAVGKAMANGNNASIEEAQTIVNAAKNSGKYDDWLQMLITYYNAVSAEGRRYINTLNHSPFGTKLQQSGVTSISGNPTASGNYGAYQTAYQSYMAATTS